LTNLFRTPGGRFGCAFVTTMLARRTQYHQSVLVAHATPFDPQYRATLDSLSHYFVSRGYTVPDAALHAKAQLARIVLQQASFLGFMDCFWLLAVACLIGGPIIFLTRKILTPPSPAGAHYILGANATTKGGPPPTVLPTYIILKRLGRGTPIYADSCG